MTLRRRLDAELVRRELAPSRRQATLLIAEHKVTVGGAITTNPARMVAPSEAIAVVGPAPRFVGRGGEKLQAALEAFDLDVDGSHALDIGASTGGFTDCLLQNGAASVVALDVGHGQLHERLRGDERVHVLERTNIRNVSPADLAQAPFPVVTIDVSFISLRTILPAVILLTTSPGSIVALVKPQFEAGRVEVSKGRGVVSDPEIWRNVLRTVVDAFGTAGAATMDLMVSPLTGADGNVEFLAHFRTDTPAQADNGMVDRVVTDAITRTGGTPKEESN